MNDSDFDQMVDRWREAHQGVARAGRIAVLTNGSTYAAPAGSNNKDMEYGNLRLQNRDELRESSRMHKHMLGTVDDVNRANAETAEQIFTGWSTVPRLERRRDTLNFKLLPLFGSTAANVEFDFESPEKPDRESDNAELLAKANAAKVFIDAGFDPHAVLEEIGLPDMAVVEKAEQQPALPPGWVPGAPALPSAAPDAEQQAMNALRYLSTLNGHHALEGSRK
jgi:phage portal protein BeeE